MIHKANGFDPSVETNSPFDFHTQLRLKETEVDLPEKPLTPERTELIIDLISADFEAVASDLKTFDLAKGHATRLVRELVSKGAQTEADILRLGAIEFHGVARSAIGPVWASYVNEALLTAQDGETFLFAARDSTPMFWAARGLINNDNHPYQLTGARFVHADWNRWFMGQEDETEDGQKPLRMDNPTLMEFYKQLGFGNGKTVKIIEPGAWGSAANAIKQTMADQPFELWFMFSHMPDRIYGFLNSHLPNMETSLFEIINDSAEAMPKHYVRPTELTTTPDGKVVADLSGKVLKSPFMKLWSWSVNQGAFDAGKDFAAREDHDISQDVARLQRLSFLSSQGIWTGILPRNTLTWTEGEKWRANWQWGKIPPLK